MFAAKGWWPGAVAFNIRNIEHNQSADFDNTERLTAVPCDGRTVSYSRERISE
jgi:hypothetical protein